MGTRLSNIRTQMTIYGGLFGILGGGFLGAGFVSLIYNPFHDMNIILIFVGTLATMFVGLAFGALSGLLSGVSISVLTSLFFKQPRFQILYKLLMAGLTVCITGALFFQMAYMVGRPFIYNTAINHTWVWALIVSLVGALVASTLTTGMYIERNMLKSKRR